MGSEMCIRDSLKAVKSDIARMYTVLRERELGISQEPAATESKEK